jgi:hypothetical protein
MFLPSRETFDVHTKPDPSNVAYTAAKLGMHTDLAYENYVPGVSLSYSLIIFDYWTFRSFLDVIIALHHAACTSCGSFSRVCSRIWAELVDQRNNNNIYSP